MSFKTILFTLIILLIVAYLLGPRPSKPKFNPAFDIIPPTLSELDLYVKEKEGSVDNLKKDNHARIIWANDTLMNKTKYSLLYIHGFSASYREGYPINENFAKRYGVNAYFARLCDHGLNQAEPMINLNADCILESARESLNVAKELGDRVIIMGTSMGAALSLKLVSEYPNLIKGLIIFSPCLKIGDPSAFIMDKPWGLQIARLITGSKYIVDKEDFPGYLQYWTSNYRIEAVVALQNLVHHTMNNRVYRRVIAPTFVAYYHKNDEQEDKVVSVPAIRKMTKELSVPEDKLVVMEVENGAHVLCSPWYSPDWEKVQKGVFNFAEKNLGLVPIATNGKVEVDNVEVE